MSTPMLAAAKRGFREIHAVVVSAGLMDRTVKVRVGGRIWNSKVQKYFDNPQTHLVHDPNNSLVTGDFITMQPGWKKSKHKRHVVTQIIAAAGKPADERPPVPTVAERIAEGEAKRAAKLERRWAREAAEAAMGREAAEAAKREAAKLEKEKRRQLQKEKRQAWAKEASAAAAAEAASGSSRRSRRARKDGAKDGSA